MHPRRQIQNRIRIQDHDEDGTNHLLEENLSNNDLEDGIDININRRRSIVTTGRPAAIPRAPPTPWTPDADCVDQEDPVSMENIPIGRGFRLEAENRCYNIETVAQMKQLQTPLVGPMSRIPFTEQDKRRIRDYLRNNSTQQTIGGRKRKTKGIKTKRTKRTKRTKKINKKAKTTRRK